jgi:hypothetical protein
MEVEDQAMAGLLGSIRGITVPVKLGDLLDSNPKIWRALATDPLLWGYVILGNKHRP